MCFEVSAVTVALSPTGLRRIKWLDVLLSASVGLIGRVGKFLFNGLFNTSTA